MITSLIFVSIGAILTRFLGTCLKARAALLRRGYTLPLFLVTAGIGALVIAARLSW
jgi:hypothetical protein